MNMLTQVVLVSALSFTALSQPRNVYEVYAIEYTRPATFRSPASDIAIGATSSDSITWAFYIWYLKGDNGRRIMVDAGFVADSAELLWRRMTEYERPDLALRRINVNPGDITDVVITHGHWDHAGGVDLFPKATVWIQKNDFAHLVGDAWQEGGDHRGLEKQDALKIIQANLDGRLRLVDGDSLEIIPGIRVFIGSKHSYESQHLLVDTGTEKVMLASDDSWFYYNLDHLLSVTFVLDPKAYISELGRMKRLVSDPQLIIPGHDALVLSRFPAVAKGVVRIR